MHLTKRILLLAVAALAAGFVAVPTASADTATCTFSGVTGSLTPKIKPVTEPGGGNGTYTFAGGASCEYVDTTGAGSGTEYNTTATITSSGEYQDNVCGTGFAFSRWNLPPATNVGSTTMNFANANATDISSVRYMIRFTSGAGALVMQEINGSGSGAGFVQILPAAGSSCVTGGVTQFDVLGGFTGIVS